MTRDLTVGVVGVGIIGGGIARALARAGWPLVVRDRHPEKIAPFGDGAIAASAADVARRSDVVIVSVFSEQQVREVFTADDGLLRGARRGLVIVTVSTVGVPLIEELRGLAERAGVTLLDCGVTGGRESAREGRLVVMIGGPAAAVDRVRPVLEAFTTLVVHVGPSGAGIRAKLARQLITYSAYYAAQCASEIATKAGVDLDELAKAIRKSDEQTGGPATQQLARRSASVETREHQAAACHKDVGAARDLAASLGIDLPIADLVLAHVDDIYRLGSRRD
jgi:3-hydroxyisobutyrate dehydrogenase-like beta-hydroxyacid dehydrogenase